MHTAPPRQAPALYAKAALQQRLLTTIARRGTPRTLTLDLRLADIAAFTGVRLVVLAACAHRRREVDDALQLQLSLLFSLWERGLLVKVKEGDAYVLRRIATPAGVVEPPRARIDLTGFGPRILWR